MDEEEEDCELSPEQLEKLVQYQEVTGVEDFSFARMELTQHEWNVESAVQNHLSIQDSPQRLSQSDSIPRSQSTPNASTSGVGGLPAAESTEAERGGSGLLALLPTRTVFRIFGWCYYLLSLPMKFIYSFVYRLFIPLPRRADPVGDVIEFIREYEAEFGLQHPVFFQGSYSQALNHAKSELKFLVVYLHCRDNQDTAHFCRNVLSDSRVVDYLNTNIIFWGCSVLTGEGYKVSQDLRENGYPFLAVIVLKDTRMTVVGRFEGPQEVDPLLQRIQNVVRDNEAYLVLARADRQEREINAALRQEQDAAYLESLRADQEKARKRQEELEAETKQRQEERAQEQSILEEKERRRRLKIEWVDKVPKEPEEGEEGVIHIVAKLPQGTRLDRRFYGSDSLSGLYYYIFCHPDSPDRFQVTTNFPRKFVPCEPVEDEPVSMTFNDFGLPQRTMLFVTDLDA